MVSVVVPVLIRNESQYGMTVRCLEAAKTKTKVDFETVIVETESKYFRDYADVHIYEKKRSSPTKSMNRGFKCSSGDVVVLLTNDVMVSEGWLECLLDCFKISDCGLSTLATTQFQMQKQNTIAEGIWFSVAAIPKEDAWFDESYDGAWDDSDLIMRVYQKGKKMYRNWNCVVEHSPGTTLYAEAAHNTRLSHGKATFQRKWLGHEKDWIYNVLVTGYVI